MSGNDMLVMVPTRGRRANCERLLKSFTETATCADLLFILDPDDPAYEGMDWGPAATAVLDPREFLVGKLNKTALAMADVYPVLQWVGDDNVFVTPGWDAKMLAALEDLGGTGWVYPDDKRRSDVPEHWMASSDVVKALGWYANPAMGHFYIDNTIAELGKRAGLIRWCPDVVIEHLHYSVAPETVRDELYLSTEERFGASDLQAFQEYRANQLPHDVALLRRHFSKDVAWVLGRVALCPACNCPPVAPASPTATGSSWPSAARGASSTSTTPILSARGHSRSCGGRTTPRPGWSTPGRRSSS